MGGRIVLPEADQNITKVIKNFHFTPKDISDFWKIFQRMDRAKNGLVPLNLIFKKIHCERNLITDVLLELLEIEHDGEINFSDFLLMVTTYCFFEPVDILKFCFYVFDQDKTGFFSVDDLNNLVNAVHNIKSGTTVRGTVKASWNQLTFKADQMEFAEFKAVHNQFPRLFQPAFRLQQQMMLKYKGESWWDAKKEKIHDLKEQADKKIEKKKKKKQKKKNAKKQRKIMRNMGCIRYYLCPCWRSFYDPTLTSYDKMTEEEKKERDRLLALQRRQAELKVKNPETAAWLKYQKKVADKTYVIETIEEDHEFAMDAAQGSGDASGILGNLSGINTTTAATVPTAPAAASQGGTVAMVETPRSASGGAGGGDADTPRSSMNSQTGTFGIGNSKGKGKSAGGSETGTPRQQEEQKQQAPVLPTSPAYAGDDASVSSYDSYGSSIPGGGPRMRIKKVVVNNYLDDKLGSTERHRTNRAEARAERKKMRQKDPELQHRARTTVSGAQF